MDTTPLARRVKVSLMLTLAAASAIMPIAAPAAQGLSVPPTATPASSPSFANREIRAQLVPRRYTSLAAEIGATVNRVYVLESHSFRRGDTLVQFDCSLQQAQLNKAKAALGAAEMIYRANQRLTELNSIGSMELHTSEAEVQKARADVAIHEAVLSKCSVVAPFDGRIAEQRVREQQYVQPGQTLLEILDDSELELEFIVPSRWLGWITVGHSFHLQIDETGRSYPAKISEIAARVDPVSQSIKLRGQIEGTFKELLAGMSGRVLLAPPSGS